MKHVSSDNEFICVYCAECVSGAGESEESGSVSVCRDQPAEDRETGAAEKSWGRGEYQADVTHWVKHNVTETGT